MDNEKFACVSKPRDGQNATEAQSCPFFKGKNRYSMFYDITLKNCITIIPRKSFRRIH